MNKELLVIVNQHVTVN